MFELPSMPNIIISTIVFFIAVWFFNRQLDQHEIPKGMTRGIMVLVLAYLVSWGAGKVVDWTQVKIEGPQAKAKTPEDLSQLLKEVGHTQP